MIHHTESLEIEVVSTQAIKLSPDGRYIVVQAHESLKNDACSIRGNHGLWSVVLCDLLEGKTIGASLTSTYNVSIALDDESLHVYRLTRDGAIESSKFMLPELVLSERQYLAVIPANCCCSTCGKAFDSQCNVSTMEYEDVKSVLLGHTPINIDRSSINTVTCEPLIVRITSPSVELKLVDIQDALLLIHSSRLFPKILNHQGEIIDDAFTNPRRTCIMELGVHCSCAVCSTESESNASSCKSSKTAQMQTDISSFQLPSGLPIPPQQIEETHRLSENAIVKALSVPKETKLEEQKHISRLQAILGDEIFPWDSFIEFQEAMEEIKEIFDQKAYVKSFSESGKFGIGCQIPLFVHTFTFFDNDEEDLHWSSARTVGWIEEDLGWFYERFFESSFEGARRWYEFPAYHAINKKLVELKSDKSSKGDRFRKYFGEEEGKGKVQEISSLKKKSNNSSVAVIEFDDKTKSLVPGLIMKDVFNTMSDVVPGLGKVFEERFHRMMSQSMISEVNE